MTMFLAPYTALNDLDGSPLDAGFIYFGEYGKDPESFPVEVYFDPDFTIPAAQPIRTRNGYPVRNGSPTKVYLKTAQHSIVIKNRKDAFVLVDFKNKGWSADFVVDGDKNQKQINDAQKAKNEERKNILDFGGKKNTAADAAITAMANALGFVRIPEGQFLLNGEYNIDVPIEFEQGGNLYAIAGSTIRIRNTVTSPVQYIFQGDGNWYLGINGVTNKGEESRQLHASWFGARGGIDCTKQIQKACASVENLREAVIDFDIGNYFVNDTILVNRCTLIKGQGSRRTVFRTSTDGFDMFKTNGEGVVFEGIQFECDNVGLNFRTSGHWINLQHDNCKVIDAQIGHTNYGIISTGDLCEVRGIRGVYGTQPSVNSYMINVAKCSSFEVEGVTSLKTGFNPAHAILLGGENQTGTVNGVNIQDIRTQSPVSLRPKPTMSLARISIDGVQGIAATSQDCAVLIETNSGDVTEVNIRDIQINNQYNSALHIKQNSLLARLVVDDITAQWLTSDSSQSAINYEYISGTIEKIFLKSGCAATNRPHILKTTGLPSGHAEIKIAPELLNMSAVLSQAHTIADNEVITVNTGKTSFSSIVDVAFNSGSISKAYSKGMLRRASSPSAVSLIDDVSIVYATEIKTASAATAGKLTVSANADGTMALVNRTGASINLSILVTV